MATILLCLLPCLLAAKPATKPAEPERVDPLVLSAVVAIETDDLRSLVREADAKAEEVVARPGEINTADALSVATVREFGRFFGRLPALSNPDKRLLSWLIQQPKLAPTLMMAISPQDPPDGLLEALRALYDDQGEKLAQYPDLVAAFVSVWDSTGDVSENDPRKVDLPRVVRLYRYYTAANKSLRFDVKDLPWQLSTWVVANPLSEPEILWAREMYLNTASVPGVFFDPPNKANVRYVETVQRDGDLLFTLPNIAKNGASLTERSHFAVSVARTLGVPAGTCRGLRHEGDENVARPAWTAMLEANNRRVRWNLDTARQPEHLGWRGIVVDPQTYGELSDSELAQTAALQPVSLEARLASVGIWKLMDVVPQRKQPELLLKAIDISPGNLRAWKSLMELAQIRKIPDLQAEAYAAAIEKHLVKTNGVFAFEAYLAMVGSRGSMQQLDLLDRPAKWFAAQPEYLAMVRLEQGRALEALKQPEKALAAYRDSIAQQPKNGPLVLAALERADVLMRNKNQLGGLITLYADIWPRLPRPKPSSYAPYTPWVIIGRMYAQALEDAGRANEARNARSLSDSVFMGR